MSTRETIKMARRTDQASTLGLPGANMMAAGKIICSMEQQSTDGPMGIFTKEAGKKAKEMASALYGTLPERSYKVSIRIIG